MSQIPLGTQFIGLASTYQTTERRSALINNESQPYTMQDIIDTVGGRLEGTQYVFVAADGTDVQNAAELQAAYVTAQGMSPSITNRITVIAAPGNYNFGSTTFVMNTQYIDLVSLDGNKSVVFNSANSLGTISITANDVFVKGVDVVNKRFTIASGLNLLKVENCKGGDNSFGSNVTVSGTFTNCTGGSNSFGFGSDATGTFTNCTAGQGSFAMFANASGIFTNCSSTDGDIFGYSGTASGTFNNCTAGIFSFGCNGIANGIFTNCVADFDSFGGGMGFLEGLLYYCRLTNGSFQTVAFSGVTRLCIDGSNVINNQG